MKKFVINSVWAGVMISIGAVTYINCPNQIVGAFLFSIGLCAILMLQFNLYTGLVGNAKSMKAVPDLLIVLLGNFAGASFATLFHGEIATLLWQDKMNKPLLEVFVHAILCGILMYIAVYAYKKLPDGNNILITMLAVATFIISGAEHSVADMCFMFAARDFTFRSLGFIAVVVIGNSLGSLTLGGWVRGRE